MFKWVVGISLFSLMVVIFQRSLFELRNPGPETIEYGARGMAVVVDGDSLRLNGHEIRLAGIDACEHDQVGERDGDIWPCGQIARDTLKVITKCDPIICQWTEWDGYDRALANCYIAHTGLHINAQMVKEGLAWAYRQNGIPIDPEIGKIEETAKRHIRGVWAATIQHPKEWRDGNR